MLKRHFHFWTEAFKDEETGEPNPNTYEYVLKGNATNLDAVETLIHDLCKRFGIPENEEDGLGLFVPQRQLMKVLVGSDTEFYRGNIQYMDLKPLKASASPPSPIIASPCSMPSDNTTGT